MSRWKAALGKRNKGVGETRKMRSMDQVLDSSLFSTVIHRGKHLTRLERSVCAPE